MRPHLFTIIGVFVCTITLHAQPDLQRRIDSLLQDCYTHNGFSGEVRLTQNGNTIYHGNFNVKDNHTNRYRVGSVTKLFTSVLTFQMIEEGKLTLDTHLDTYFPDIPNADEITIGQMLSHTSGIFNITEWEQYYSTRREYFSRERVIEIINDHKPTFKPGKDNDYSNSNYILLGYILEDINGKTYPELIEERIAQPLGLRNTYCDHGNPDRTKREVSYYFNGASWLPDVDSDPSLPAAAGALVSSTEDLCLFMQGMFNGQLVKGASLDSMRSLVSRQFGHGIMKAPFYEHIGWGHTGSIDEFSAFAGYFPDDQLAMAITSNGMTMDLNALMVHILSIYFDTGYTKPEFPSTDISDPASSVFVGEYRAWLFGIIPLGILKIEEASPNHLFMLERSDYAETERLLLIRKDAMTFYSPDNFGDLRFEMNKADRVKRVYLIQGNLEIKCNRL